MRPAPSYPAIGSTAPRSRTIQTFTTAYFVTAGTGRCTNPMDSYNSHQIYRDVRAPLCDRNVAAS